MKKKILIGFATLAIAAVAALNMNFSAKSNGLSDVSLANVEALADGNENKITHYCAWPCPRGGNECIEQDGACTGTTCSSSSYC
ncbi:MAG: NVEALA domain-containing protein [Candidatus Azobacteroides sp.]|nr:NVEALA domain-containing protein [Candidatus Azobacteroides sp.]